MRLLRASLAALLVVLVMVPTAMAQSLEMTTPFPAVVADPGASVNFNVTVTTEIPERVDLSVTSQPEGWTATLRGGGSTVSAVTTAADPEAANQIRAQFTVEVEVPDQVTPGPNRVVVEGRSASGLNVQLPLDLTIVELVPGSVVLDSDFPTQGGSADETFSFDLELSNNSNQEVTLSFEADAPPGWSVRVRPGTGETSATTMILAAGGISSVNVTADPPADAAAAVYTIPIRAIGGPEVAQAEVSVEITGSFGMLLTTSDQRLSTRVNVGSPTTLTLAITNTGTARLEGVELTATPPRNWTVNFQVETIDSIEPGATQNVEATIETSGNAVAGDYAITVRARHAEVNDEIEIRTTVETSPIGGLIGIAILIVVAVTLFFVFQRYGRR